ncbi:hypothetical protein A3C57_01775 [Candidatus Nomurabacteria bacterium RIFCSPHIGHO2_02_FULL_33_12]|nr:MAG: hypothetical protein A3C57_01775 [Candidatus Nomurabacteria bacterium RIFCSPHIGHO2_02_FULL_33_12]
MLENIKKNKVFIAIIVLLVIVLVYIGFFQNKKPLNTAQNGYSVVYVTTGEVYVGKLKVFPSFRMTDPYLYQVTKDAIDPNKTNLQVQPLKDAPWAPKYINFKRSNIVFYGPLEDSSKIAEALAGK